MHSKGFIVLGQGNKMRPVCKRLVAIGFVGTETVGNPAVRAVVAYVDKLKERTSRTETDSRLGFGVSAQRRTSVILEMHRGQLAFAVRLVRHIAEIHRCFRRIENRTLLRDGKSDFIVLPVIICPLGGSCPSQ